MSDEEWVTLKMPRAIMPGFCEAREGFWLRSGAEGVVMPATDQGRIVALFEAIIADFNEGQRPLVHRVLLDMDAEQQAKYYSKLRDDFRCVNCGSQRLNTGTIGSHHIVPKGQKGTRQYEWMAETFGGVDVVENLATLCAACHGRAHESWRKVAPYLLTKIGTPYPKELFSGD